MAHFAATQANYGKYVPMSSLKAVTWSSLRGKSGSSAITHVGIYREQSIYSCLFKRL